MKQEAEHVLLKSSVLIDPELETAVDYLAFIANQAENQSVNTNITKKKIYDKIIVNENELIQLEDKPTVHLLEEALMRQEVEKSKLAAVKTKSIYMSRMEDQASPPNVESKYPQTDFSDLVYPRLTHPVLEAK